MTNEDNRYVTMQILHCYYRLGKQYKLNCYTELPSPGFLPVGVVFWPTTSTARSLNAGVAAGDHKMQVWNQDIDACV